MPRAIWSGTISFGLVAVPVRMYSAITEHTLHFNLLHVKDDGPIGYRKVCKVEDKPVPDKEIVKAYEVAKGKYVHLSDEDFEAARADGLRAIEIHEFVPYDEIDPILFRHTYYLGPQDGGEKVYALLRQALEDAGLVAIATFVMRDREHLGCLRVREGVLTLEQMYFVDEVRPPDEIVGGKVKVDKRELEMAERLIESFTGHFDPERYHDRYRDELARIIKAKRKGEEVHVAPTEEPEEPTDLLEALRASIEARKGSRNGRARGRDGLSDLSREELYERAKDAEIPGRSQMSKDELVEALRHAA
jgi:DNA end-binding protein Ku